MNMTETAASQENHYFNRAGWLRASVLGANDGIVSTASLIAGVASAGVPVSDVLLAGTAGLVAGAMSMAAGEYVSVSSQADSEKADLAREAQELRTQPEFERQELADIYVQRGLDPDLARQVAEQMMAKDALATHARDELGITMASKPRPIQAALSSAASFTVGAALPLAAVVLSPQSWITINTTVASVIALGLLGGMSASTGGAPITRAVMRVTFWGAAAMAATALVGALFGTTIS
ncbi:VIT1/CCC1 transporter family protein [Aliiroseovarius lamellibrachiae]|uniref:VIT1/CCC1 transporter family protein n=1 Tax=Aliiroseovarius lamellibrachiae TaxID=1924933 RepID=UPI001BDFCF7F|nr:VIT family protein [Aliiroseovarius lamellibrachiae]MBT2131580.1 VIT family protein [Aliiroseovarius lamellibrachiae]